MLGRGVWSSEARIQPMKQHVSLSDRIASIVETGNKRFAAGTATTNGSFWSCDVFVDGITYCSVCNVNTQEEAEWRANTIANALNSVLLDASKQ
jgi:hypothetical protein